MVDRRLYRASRLAFLYMTGQWPPELIDHNSLNRADDRWSNLRKATRSENNTNVALRADNKSGFKGVNWRAQNSKWCAQISIKGKVHHLGYFDTPERAFIAYVFAAWRPFGDFALIDADYLTAIRRWKARKAHEHSVLRNLLVSTASE